MSESVNPGVDRVQNAINDLLWEPLTEAALVALFAEVPVLAVWPLKQIISGFVRWVSRLLWEQIDLYTDLAAVHLLNAKHRSEFDRESVRLRMIAVESGVDSEDFRKARDEATKTFAKFIRFNG